MTAPPISAPLTRRDVVTMSALALITALIGVLVQRSFHPGLPVGMDIDLWSFGALNLHAGNPARVPPAYPGLAAVLMGLTGCDHLRATTAVSAGAMAAVPPLAWLLARRLGATPLTSWLAAGIPLLTPSLVFWGHQVTPDPLTAAGFLVLALAAARATAQPSVGNLALLYAATAWLYLTREHGLVAAVLVANLVAVLPGSGRARVLRVAGLLLVLWLVPLLAFHTPSLPTDLPWWRRVNLVIDDRFASEPSWTRNRGAEDLADNPFSLASFAIRNAPFAWLWIALAGLGALRLGARGHAVLLVAVAPVLPALLIFSQPRHVLVAVPVATAVMAAAVARFEKPRRWLVLALAVTSTLGAWHDWSNASRRQRALTLEAIPLAELGRAICDIAPPEATWTGELRSFTFCPLPHNPDHTVLSNVHWHSLFASPTEPGAPWELLDLGLADTYIYMVRFTGDERPCAGSLPAPGSPWQAMDMSPPELIPPCDAPAPRSRRQRPPRRGGI
jgi:hypothetical protein